MSTIDVVTSDNIIWNQVQVYKDIVSAMATNRPILLNLLAEGPDLESIGVYEFLCTTADEFNYDLKNVTVKTDNLLERHDTINIVYNASTHLVDNSREYLIDIHKQNQLNHFGMFIGRSNAPRLKLASYINNRYADITILSYHFNRNDEFHLSNIGIDHLIKYYHCEQFDIAANFLKQCPITLQHKPSVTIDKSLSLNPAQQLLNNDADCFSQTYQNFFVELVCESYFTGNTFFVTEKTWRPMMLKTPFILQGPQYFLHNLKKLGFQTFDQWWDEGYAEDPSTHQLHEIIKIIDNLAKKTQDELLDMYNNMLPVLEHNYNRVMSLTSQDLKILHNAINH